MIAKQERERVAQLIENTRGLAHDERVKKLESELEARLIESQLVAVESLEALASWGSDRFDYRVDDDDAVDETSLLRSARGVVIARSERDLDFARDLGRALAQENEFAIGAHEARLSYTVGTGLRWKLVPRDVDSEVRADTAAVSAALERVLESVDTDGMGIVEEEALRRADRDGEALLLQAFPAFSPMTVRFLEPEDVRQPAGSPHLFGVETLEHDVRTVLAYHVRRPGTDPLRIDAKDVTHLRLNVDLNSRRGWPTMWPIRRNLARAEKLLRNMSYVAALQAAIAVIRKHETASQADVNAFLGRAADLIRTNVATGQETKYKFMRAGTVLDSGPGVSYEAPVSSVNAANNVQVLQAELRACGARLNMPEFMFSGDASNSDYASTLVAEAPATKGFERLQVRVGAPMKRVVWRGLRHEESRGELSPGLLNRYALLVSYPGLTVRDRLQEAQGRQIMQSAGVLSRLTWRSMDGLDDQVEERNMKLEAQRGYAVRGEAPPNGEFNKPPVPGAVGGAAKANPANPLTARAQL